MSPRDFPALRLVPRALVPWLSLALCGAAAAQQPFTEEALERGIDYDVFQNLPQIQFGTCAAFCDLDGDGDADIVLLGARDDRVGLFENDGTGHFTERSSTSGIAALSGPSGVTAADYDGDGDLDLYLTRSIGKNRLHRNNGDWTFSSAGAAAGVEDEGAGMGAAWGDVNGDGWLDLYVANRTTTLDDPHRNAFFLNRGNGSFVESAAQRGIQAGDDPTFQPVFFDLELDGDIDLYLSTDKGYNAGIHNHLYRNTNGVFSEITAASNTAANFNSMGCTVGDWDRNGLPDIYITNTPQGNALFKQLGVGFFADRTAVHHVGSFALGWGTCFLDYNNDGRLDLYVANANAPNRLYEGVDAGPSPEVAPELGVADQGITYGVVRADVDLDGDLDLLVSSWFDRARLYINNEGERRSWLRLRVVGEGRNLHAVGASVQVRNGGEWQLGQVIAGASYKGQNELTLSFGLGEATVASEVRVVWPGGAERTLRRLPVNHEFAAYPTSRLGDVDGDGDVDSLDYAEFRRLRDAYEARGFAPGCEVVDFDGDSDVDAVDHELFLRRYEPDKAQPHFRTTTP